MHGPNPETKHPMEGFPRVRYIKNTVENPNIVIGDYTYYDDPEDSENFGRNVLYHFPFIGDKLIIGKFCAISRGVKSVGHFRQLHPSDSDHFFQPHTQTGHCRHRKSAPSIDFHAFLMKGFRRIHPARCLCRRIARCLHGSRQSLGHLVV